LGTSIDNSQMDGMVIHTTPLECWAPG